MRKIVELAINILFWAVAYYIMIRLLAFEEVNIEASSDGTVVVESSYNPIVVLSLTIGLIFKIVFYYLNVYFLSNYFKKQNWPRYLRILLPIIFLFLFVEITVKVIFVAQSFPSNLLLWFNSGLNFFFQYSVLALISIAHVILLRSRQEALQQQQLEREKTTAELQALKAQINPHFLFNALNNLLSITNKAGNREASAAITQLSDMMRFLLHDVSQQRIPLRKEIEFIENYIALNRLRFSEEDDIKIHFEYDVAGAIAIIEPALLIPFVENAYKHGIDIFKPSFVFIRLSANADRSIEFNIENSIHHRADNQLKQEAGNSGIGLKNVKERLHISYPDRHQLSIQQTTDRYQVQLNIQL